MAVSFDGTDDRIDVTQSAAPTMSACSGYVWTDNIPSTGSSNRYILLNATSGFSNPTIFLQVFNAEFYITFYTTAGDACQRKFTTTPDSGVKKIGWSWGGVTTTAPTAYMDGANDDSATSITNSGTWRAPHATWFLADRTTSARELTGDLGEAAIWDAVLDASDHAALADGVSPLLIRPTDLVFYLPMYTTSSPEYIDGAVPSTAGDPTTIEHPAIAPGFWPANSPSHVATGGGGGPTIPVLRHHYHTMRAA